MTNSYSFLKRNNLTFIVTQPLTQAFESIKCNIKNTDKQEQIVEYIVMKNLTKEEEPVMALVELYNHFPHHMRFIKRQVASQCINSSDIISLDINFDTKLIFIANCKSIMKNSSKEQQESARQHFLSEIDSITKLDALLCFICQWGSLNEIKLACKKCRVNCQDHSGLSPLHHVSWRLDESMTRFLLNLGANKDFKSTFQSETPLDCAIFAAKDQKIDIENNPTIRLLKTHEQHARFFTGLLNKMGDISTIVEFVDNEEKMKNVILALVSACSKTYPTELENNQYHHDNIIKIINQLNKEMFIQQLEIEKRRVYALGNPNRIMNIQLMQMFMTDNVFPECFEFILDNVITMFPNKHAFLAKYVSSMSADMKRIWLEKHANYHIQLCNQYNHNVIPKIYHSAMFMATLSKKHRMKSDVWNKDDLSILSSTKDAQKAFFLTLLGIYKIYSVNKKVETQLNKYNCAIESNIVKQFAMAHWI